MKQKLAIDMDEVLFPFLQEFSGYHNQVYGSNVSLDHFTSYQFEDILGTSATEMVRRVYEFHKLDDLHVKPVVEAQESVGALSELYELNVVTARDPRFSENTKAWIDTYFGGLFTDIIMVGLPDRIKNYRSKAEICSELGVVALVDDGLHHVQQCPERGVGGVVFGDYPWTGAVPASRDLVHCKSWPEVLEHFGVRG